MIHFQLVEPQNLRELTAFLAKTNGSSMPLAGGTDLMTLVKDRILRPEVVVDLSPLQELRGIRKDQAGVYVGTMTTIKELASDLVIEKNFPGLRHAALSIGSPQLRNVGTVGGNLCQRPRCWYFRDPLFNCRKKGGSRCFAAKGRNKYHAIFGGGICHIVHPSDLAPALISLEARVKILSPGGEREMPLENFFALPSVSVRQENILQPGEILTEVTIPSPPPGRKSIYLKFTERSSWDFAVVSVAASGIIEGRRIIKPRVILGGVAPIPWRLQGFESRIDGRELKEAAVAAAALEALEEARPLEENRYKVDLAEVWLTRAVLSLLT
ncbi:MAG: FAD binding domain-containing protein [Candidatus Aminicenantales bacterium]